MQYRIHNIIKLSVVNRKVEVSLLIKLSNEILLEKKSKAKSEKTNLHFAWEEKEIMIVIVKDYQSTEKKNNN